MEIKVGDYVRTKEFGINRVKWFDNEEPILENGFTALQNSGYKSSPNIIDLIEIGDYVNGKKVANKQYHYVDEEHYADGEWCIFYENVTLGEYQYDIKSIVTKEQFSQMEYKIND